MHAFDPWMSRFDAPGGRRSQESVVFSDPLSNKQTTIHNLILFLVFSHAFLKHMVLFYFKFFS